MMLRSEYVSCCQLFFLQIPWVQILYRRLVYILEKKIFGNVKYKPLPDDLQSRKVVLVVNTQHIQWDVTFLTDVYLKALSIPKWIMSVPFVFFGTNV